MFGRDPWTDAVEIHRRIAYVPGDVTLWRNLSGGEVIDLYGRLRGGLDPRPPGQADRADQAGPDEKKGQHISKGNRQKVALVAAFASDVDLLILDEPNMSGLDPLMEEVFQRCVAEERERGRTLLLSSHILSEVEELCDRVSIIRKGVATFLGVELDADGVRKRDLLAQLALLDVPVADHRVRVRARGRGDGRGRSAGRRGFRIRRRPGASPRGRDRACPSRRR
ncbi:hypothetical protein SALBM217S_03810 [Streptomyces griseoloalbus]